MFKNRESRNESVQPYEGTVPERASAQPAVAPNVDIFENENELLLVADLPGVEKDALKINLHNDELRIEATRPMECAGAVLGCEFRSVDFCRVFSMPTGIDHSTVSADLKNGVLYLHLPKSEEIKPRQITVRAG